MFTNPKHVWLIINTPNLTALCHAQGITWYPFGSSRHHHPCPHSALDPLTRQGNVYPNCSLWQQVRDGALKEKVQSVWVRGKMRRERGGLRRDIYCNPESQPTLVQTGSWPFLFSLVLLLSWKLLYIWFSLLSYLGLIFSLSPFFFSPHLLSFLFLSTDVWLIYHKTETERNIFQLKTV